MSRAYKGIEINVYGKVSERSAGAENVAYLQNKLKTMKMADLVRYLVNVARRYESGELFGSEVKRILAELQLNGQVSKPEPTAEITATVPNERSENELSKINADADLINDLLDSIHGLD
jgi:hypothetical protein